MTNEGTRRYVIAYDVHDDRRRSRVAKKLESYGDRVQFSVFVVEVRAARFERLRAALVNLIEPYEDSVLFCDMGPLAASLDTRFTYLGQSRPLTGNSAIIA